MIIEVKVQGASCRGQVSTELKKIDLKIIQVRAAQFEVSFI